MKALLVTRCGCSRTICVPEDLRNIRVPLLAVPADYANEFSYSDTPYREFEYHRRGIIGDEVLCVYRECAAQHAERGRPGSAVVQPPTLACNGERTDCLVAGPRPPAAASPQQGAVPQPHTGTE